MDHARSAHVRMYTYRIVQPNSYTSVRVVDRPSKNNDKASFFYDFSLRQNKKIGTVRLGETAKFFYRKSDVTLVSLSAST